MLRTDTGGGGGESAPLMLQSGDGFSSGDESMCGASSPWDLRRRTVRIITIPGPLYAALRPAPLDSSSASPRRGRVSRGEAMENTTLNRSDRDTADLIAIAIEAERKAAWFYETMAKMASDAVVKMTLIDLSNDERSHAETLTRLYVEIAGHDLREHPEAAVEGGPDPFDFPSSSRRAALEFALKNEINAAELYQTQAETSDDPSRAEIFRRLAATEREHAAWVRIQLLRTG
jgi:rubrerythrin